MRAKVEGKRGEDEWEGGEDQKLKGDSWGKTNFIEGAFVQFHNFFFVIVWQDKVCFAENSQPLDP